MTHVVVGIIVFWSALIASIIIYVTKRKWYPIAYLVSASLYSFTVAFVIDKFHLGPNLIMGFLAFSALLMIGTGFFIARKISK